MTDTKAPRSYQGMDRRVATSVGQVCVRIENELGRGLRDLYLIAGVVDIETKDRALAREIRLLLKALHPLRERVHAVRQVTWEMEWGQPWDENVIGADDDVELMSAEDPQGAN